jgi:hypothetical protein
MGAVSTAGSVLRKTIAALAAAWLQLSWQRKWYPSNSHMHCYRCTITAASTGQHKIQKHISNFSIQIDHMPPHHRVAIGTSGSQRSQVICQKCESSVLVALSTPLSYFFASLPHSRLVADVEYLGAHQLLHWVSAVCLCLPVAAEKCSKRFVKP